MGVSELDEVVDEVVDEIVDEATDEVKEVDKSGEVTDEAEVADWGAAFVKETGAGTGRTSDC